MPRPAQKQPRQITLKTRKVRQGTRFDVYQQMAVLFAAAGAENTPVYLREDKNGAGATVRLYAPDDPVECWVDLYDDLEGQLRALILEIWGRDTLKEAQATVALGGAERASEAPEGGDPTSDTGRGRKKP